MTTAIAPVPGVGEDSDQQYRILSRFDGGLNLRFGDRHKMSNQMVRLQNCIPGGRDVRPRRGSRSYSFTVISGGAAVPLYGGIRFYPPNGSALSKLFIVADNDSFYASADDSGQTNYPQGTFGSALLAGQVNTSGVSMIQWKGNVYAVNGNMTSSGMAAFDGTAGTMAKVTSGTDDPPDNLGAGCGMNGLEVFFNRLWSVLAGGILRYCDINLATEWPGINRIVPNNDDGLDIRAIKRINLGLPGGNDDVLVVFKPNQIYGIFNLGDSKWSSSLLHPTIGAVASDSVVATPDGILFLHHTGVHRLNRDLTVQPMSRRIAPVFDASGGVGLTVLDTSRIAQAAGGYAKSWYWLTYPSTGATSGAHDHMLVCELERPYEDEEGIVEPPWYGPHTGLGIRGFVNCGGATDRGELFGLGSSASYLYLLDYGNYDNISGDPATAANQTNIAYEWQTISLPLGPSLDQDHEVYSPLVTMGFGVNQSVTLVALADQGLRAGSSTTSLVGAQKWGTPGLNWGDPGFIWGSSVPTRQTFKLARMRAHAVAYRGSGSYTTRPPRLLSITIPFVPRAMT